MFSAGIGQMDDAHADKGEPEVGMWVVKVGGPRPLCWGAPPQNQSAWILQLPTSFLNSHFSILISGVYCTVP